MKVTGDKKQVEMAIELIKEVMNQVFSALVMQLLCGEVCLSFEKSCHLPSLGSHVPFALISLFELNY